MTNTTLRFPDELVCILVDGYGENTNKTIKGFGDKTITAYPTATLKILAKTIDEVVAFNAWYFVEAQSGALEFAVNVPFMGIEREWLVRPISAMKSLPQNHSNVRTFEIEVEIIDDIISILQAQIESNGEYIL